MSDARTDAGSGQPDGGVSEEQAREYMEQLRSAPAEQVLAEVMGSVLNAAQVKLGRHDARLLIDVGALMFDHARPHLSGEVAGQVEQALGQLRLAQVEAESAPNRQEEQGDLAASPEPPSSQVDAEAAAQAGSSGATSAGGPAGSTGRARSSGRSSGTSGASKLWIPGRDF